MKSIFFLLAALLALCAASCTPNVVTTQRPGTFQQGGGTAAIFDIVITNAGSCPITTIIIDIALPTGATRGEYWNLVPEAGHYRVTSFEPQLPVGARVNAGLIVIFPTSVSAISVTLFSAVCPTSCTGTVAPTVTPTNPPTIRPTNPPTNAPTNPPTVRPTNPPTASPSNCRPSIVTTQRPGTFPQGGGTAAIFDIVISNTGSCPITTIIIDIALPTGATRGEYWNLVPEAGHYRVTSFEPQLPVGASVNAGVIVIFPTSSIPSISVTLYSVVCPTSCTGTVAPTVTPTNPPTNRPTNPPTNSPTNPPTTRPTVAPCNIAAVLVVESTWTSNGVRYATYRLVLTNNGACGLTAYVTSFALNGGEIISSWNLQSSLGGYLVQGYGGVLRPGDSYGGAGFNVRLGGEITVTPYGSNCQC